MKKIIFSLLILIIHSYTAFAHGQEDKKVYNDFCSFVSEAMTLKGDAQYRHEYIIRNFDERVGNKNLKEAYNVVFQVAPEKRYKVLKESIEKNIKSAWNCDGLKKYFDQYVNDDMNQENKFLYSLLAAFLILLCLVLLFVDKLFLPSKYGSLPMLVSRPTTYFISALPLSFGISIILQLIDKNKYEPLCKKMVAAGLMLAFIGLVIIGPLLGRS